MLIFNSTLFILTTPTALPSLARFSLPPISLAFSFLPASCFLLLRLLKKLAGLLLRQEEIIHKFSILQHLPYF